MKRYLVLSIKILFSLGIISWLVIKAYRENQFQAFFETDKYWVGMLAGFGCCLLAMVVSFLRWNILVQAIDLPFRFIDSLRIGFIGLFFNLSPVGVVGGDMLRAYYASRHVKHRIADAIATVFLDRFIGLLTMVMIATAAFLVWEPDASRLTEKTLSGLQLTKQFALLCSIMGLLVLAGFLILPSFQSRSWFQKLAKVRLIGKLLIQATQVVQMYRSRKMVLVASFLLSVLVNLLFLLAIFLLASSVLAETPSFLDHFMIEPIVMVGNAAPLPGGIGGMELAMDALYRVLSPAGPDNANGTVVAIGFRFFLLLISLLGGIVWLANKRFIKQVEDEMQASGPQQDEG